MPVTGATDAWIYARNLCSPMERAVSSSEARNGSQKQSR